MKSFAHLLDRLVLTPSRNGKIKLMVDYFARTPDPDRGYALAAITRDLDVASVKPGMLRGLMAEQMDEVLFKLSYDYVGDLAETIALVWDADRRTVGASDREIDAAATVGGQSNSAPDGDLTLTSIIETLKILGKTDALRQISTWLDQLDASGRYALLKLVTGGMRIGVSARLAKQALANLGNVDIIEIEELWHGLEIPYTDLFAWLTQGAEKPAHLAVAPFLPVMLANALTDSDMQKLDPSAYAGEWKWDGIRVQVTSDAGTRRLYSRTGDDIGKAFPDLLDHMDFEGSLDGELLVGRPQDDGTIEIGSFSDLQQRLNRKTVSKKLLGSHPVIVRAYDLLNDGTDNLRGLPFADRRKRLEYFLPNLEPTRFDLSPLIDFSTWDDLAGARENLPHPVIEGVMIKRWDSTYVPGRPKGPWFKWKRDPMIIDAVLLYAQRGHGKRSSYYSDYTFGVWKEDGELVPVGKAYFGFTDDELKQIDKYVRDNTRERFGPVRSVTAEPDHGLVLEIAFEGLNRSTRHKSGVAMRFPRISRLRWDKPPREADTLASVEALLDA